MKILASFILKLLQNIWRHKWSVLTYNKLSEKCFRDDFAGVPWNLPACQTFVPCHVWESVTHCIQNRALSKTMSHFCACVSHWISGHLPQLVLSAPKKQPHPQKVQWTQHLNKIHPMHTLTGYWQHVEFECVSFNSNNKTSREDQCNNHWCFNTNAL